MSQKNGRNVPPEKLYDFTFQDTGRTVQIRKVSSLLRAENFRQVKALPGFEEPKPPMSKVDYGEGDVLIPNPAHPVYQQLLKDWNGRVTAEARERLMHIMIRRGVVCDVDMDAVKSMRADLALDGVDLSGLDDHFVYVAFVCIGSDRDHLDLMQAIFERTVPQEAAVEAQIAAFQPDVPREAAVQPST